MGRQGVERVGKLPRIVYIYGGPAGQTVHNEWPSDLFSQILVHKGFAVFTVDNRGTPGRDRKFQTVVRHQYGAIELKDQLTALDQLFAQYPQLDRARVAIWGWRNGGYLKLYATTPPDLFKTGAYGVPGTHSHHYQSLLTPRHKTAPSHKRPAHST